MHNNWHDFIKQLPISVPTKDNSTSISTLIDLPNQGTIKVSGIDAKKFLQGQLTCNVNIIEDGIGQLGAHCNQHGRVISLFWLVASQENLYLSMPRDMTAIAISALKKYAVFFKVDITDVSDEMITVGIIKPEPSHDNTTNIISIAIPSNLHRSLIIGNQYLLLKYFNEIKNKLPRLTHDIWNTLNIRDGIPSLHPETSGIFLPHELNLDKLNAISFEKGCYTGQEIIARMHYRGKLKTRMHQAKISSNSPILPGTDIFTLENQQPRVAGKVVEACIDVNNCYNALITCEESCISGKQLFLDSNNNSYFTLTD